MPTLKQRKYSQSSTSARGSGNGANVARARERPRPEPELEPPQRQRQQPPSQPASQASQQADDGQALDQQGVIDAMVEVQNHGADLGLPPGGPLQVDPWPPLLVGRRANLPSAQQQPPPPPPPRHQQQQPSRETLLLSIARMERCSRCHLRTWSFVQDPITGALRTNALTIPNEVYNGRCLLCFPLPIGFAGAASSSVISNDDNGSDQGGRSASGAAGGTAGPENPGATETLATDSAAAAHPSDSARVDGPNNSLKRGSGIAEEEQVPAEEEPEEDVQLEDSSQQGSKSPYGAAEEDQSTLSAADKPFDGSVEQTNVVGRKRKNDSRQREKSQADNENDRGIKRCSLRSRSSKRAGVGADKRKKSPAKRRKKLKTSASELDAGEKIRATIKELSKENAKAFSQIRCLKRLLSICRTAGQEKEERIVRSIVRLRGVECLLTLMRQSESCEVQALICEILLYTLYFDKDVTLKFKVHNVLGNVLKDTLLSHPNEISLVTVLIGCLRYTTDNDSTVDREIIYDGIVDLVVDAAMRHRASPRIQLNTMLFLQDLTSELTDRSHIKRVLQSKALACAIQAIKRNWKSEAIVSAGLAVITNVFQNQEEVNHKEGVAALEGLRSILLRWIMKKSRPACLVAGSISCLSNISMEKGGVNKIIAESGLLVRATEMMNHFDDSAEVQRCGCLFLASYSRGKGKMRANQVVEAGGLEAIVYCLDTYSDDAEVGAAALGALRNINHPANHSCSVSDVIDHVLKALENHNGEEEVQDHGCQLLLQYINFPLVVNKLKAKRIQSLLTKAAREYPDSCRQTVDRIKAKL